MKLLSKPLPLRHPEKLAKLATSCCWFTSLAGRVQPFSVPALCARQRLFDGLANNAAAVSAGMGNVDREELYLAKKNRHSRDEHVLFDPAEHTYYVAAEKATAEGAGFETDYTSVTAIVGNKPTLMITLIILSP